MDTQRLPRAYSYVRFSTPEQAKGHSLQRQTDAARAWAAAAKVTLDDELTFQDKGVSGFTGANRETGELGVFLERVKDGTIPHGSWLLVESLDRISRQAARRAVRVIEDIIEHGITVVDLSDGGREYSAETLEKDPFLFMMMVLKFIRANEESATKSVRVAKAHAARREKFGGQDKLTKPYTLKLPAWIRWNTETASYELIEHRAKLLRWMFEMSDDGTGAHSIAAHLNDTKEDTWGAGKWKAKYWHRSYIRKLLTNKAAIGVFVPHTVRKIDGKRSKERIPQEPIAHRFPAAVDRDLYERVSARLSTTAPRGKNAKEPVRSIFAGLMKCQHCGGTVTRVNKGQHVYLVCAAAHGKSGTCKYESVPYAEAVSAFKLRLLGTLDDAPTGSNTADMDAKIEQLKGTVDAGENFVNELLELRITDKSRAASQRLRDAERELDEHREALRELLERRDALRSTNVNMRLAAVEKALTREPMDTEEANKALRGAVSKMVMRPQNACLDIWWHHADKPQETLFMTSRFDWDANSIENMMEED
ncbi:MULTISPECIES: recombinase family protein [unclassified Bradyrhizobium]|uniref:recombinase family protein n=1 Tax=unclassified Bradyrhizobium TaxID=2631580 RepID=UPI001FFBB1EF|nr:MULTISPECIES: recombinase family protein [unclassified Bradyrhizobium]MCK1508461.1 recombinase family protein [Bradyrhizobium sp. 18]MCK1633562.1 recombinase family protein [Bradyrhizobium sp. 162]